MSFLSLNVRMEGDKLVAKGLAAVEALLPGAIQKGLEAVARAGYSGAFDLLSGPRDPAGAYPVPVVRGHLRRLLGWVKPGASKSKGGETFTSGKFEAIVFDAAEYSVAIHEGKGSSRKYGQRPYITDSMAEVDGEKILDRAVWDFALKRSGLA